MRLKWTGYKWKPNKAQKEAYKAKMADLDTYNFIHPAGAIREGCYVKYVRTAGDENEVIEGKVIKSSYGADKGQHTFTIQDDDGKKYQAKGRNLYPRLLKHIQGEISKRESRVV